MSQTKSLAEINNWPEVAQLSVSDLVDVVSAGIRDFRAAPQFGLVVGGMYAAAGWASLALLFLFEFYYLAYPVAMGFALVAPFASVGFYSVSDFLEKGQPVSWRAVWGAVKAASKHDLRWMALITGFTFFMWVDYAAIIFLSMMGFETLSFDIIREIFTTPKGWMFLLVGNVAGAIIAIIIFSISVVTYPMLYDRNVDFVTAIITSIRLVWANPIIMGIWCAFIAAMTALALMPVFLGLFIFLPVIGHASWHLYRRGVGPARDHKTPAGQRA